MPSTLLSSFGRFSFAQANFSRPCPNSLPRPLMAFFSSSEVKCPVIAAVMVIFVTPITATVALDLGILVEGPLQDEEVSDSANRFEIGFILGVFQCKTDGFTIIVLPAMAIARTHCGVSQSFRCENLWRQPATSVVSVPQGKTNACTSSIFMKMRSFWIQCAEEEFA